jgi:hypothetical protein
VRHQPDVVVCALERLDGGLAVDHRRDDVPVVRDGLLADHDPVAVGDRGIDHGVTDDLQQEQGSVANQLLGQREDVLDGLLGQDGTTGGDPADQRHVRGVLRGDVESSGLLRLLGLRADGRVAGQAHLHRARTASVAAQVALALQGRQLVRDAGGAGQADRLADLPHRRGIAAPLHRVPDDLQDLPLPPGEHMVGVGVLGHFGHDKGNGSLGLASRPAFRSVTVRSAGAVPGRSAGRVAFHAAAHVLTSGLCARFQCRR